MKNNFSKYYWLKVFFFSSVSDKWTDLDVFLKIYFWICTHLLICQLSYAYFWFKGLSSTFFFKLCYACEKINTFLYWADFVYIVLDNQEIFVLQFCVLPSIFAPHFLPSLKCSAFYTTTNVLSSSSFYYSAFRILSGNFG